MAEPPDDEEAVIAEPADDGNLNTALDDGVVGLRRGGPSVGVVTLSDGLLGGV